MVLCCLSIVLRSHLGWYRPGEAFVGLSPLIAIFRFDAVHRKAKSLVPCPLFNLSSHYFAVTHQQPIPGKIKACPVPCNEFN